MGEDQNVLLSSRGLNVADLNVASILGAQKFAMMQQQIESSVLHVFCASETWLTTDVQTELVKVRGFNTARVDRGWSEKTGETVAKKGGGLICYVREGLVMIEHKYSHLNQSTRDLEMQWILLDMKRMRKIVIINIYRPPQGDYKKACKSISNAIREVDLKD